MSTTEALSILRKAEMPGLSALLAATRAAYELAHSLHWRTAGAQFYADHGLFERVYEKLYSFIDPLAEKLVGLSGEPQSVEAARQAQATSAALASMTSPSDPASFPIAMLAELRSYKALVEAAYVAAKNQSAGLENLLQGMADEVETLMYLLQQRSTAKSLTNEAADLLKAAQLGLFGGGGGGKGGGGSSGSHTYVKRTGVPGNYKYTYAAPKGGPRGSAYERTAQAAVVASNAAALHPSHEAHAAAGHAHTDAMVEAQAAGDEKAKRLHKEASDDHHATAYKLNPEVMRREAAAKPTGDTHAKVAHEAHGEGNAIANPGSRTDIASADDLGRAKDHFATAARAHFDASRAYDDAGRRKEALAHESAGKTAIAKHAYAELAQKAQQASAYAHASEAGKTGSATQEHQDAAKAHEEAASRAREASLPGAAELHEKKANKHTGYANEDMVKRAQGQAAFTAELKDRARTQREAAHAASATASASGSAADHTKAFAAHKDAEMTHEAIAKQPGVTPHDRTAALNGAQEHRGVAEAHNHMRSAGKPDAQDAPKGKSASQEALDAHLAYNASRKKMKLKPNTNPDGSPAKGSLAAKIEENKAKVAKQKAKAYGIAADSKSGGAAYADDYAHTAVATSNRQAGEGITPTMDPHAAHKDAAYAHEDARNTHQTAALHATDAGDKRLAKKHAAAATKHDLAAGEHHRGAAHEQAKIAMSASVKANASGAPADHAAAAKEHRKAEKAFNHPEAAGSTGGMKHSQPFADRAVEHESRAAAQAAAEQITTPPAPQESKVAGTLSPLQSVDDRYGRSAVILQRAERLRAATVRALDTFRATARAENDTAELAALDTATARMREGPWTTGSLWRDLEGTAPESVVEALLAHANGDAKGIHAAVSHRDARQALVNTMGKSAHAEALDLLKAAAPSCPSYGKACKAGDDLCKGCGAQMHKAAPTPKKAAKKPGVVVKSEAPIQAPVTYVGHDRQAGPPPKSGVWDALAIDRTAHDATARPTLRSTERFVSVDAPAPPLVTRATIRRPASAVVLYAARSDD
jgi:DNA-binding ferritin-like protein